MLKFFVILLNPKTGMKFLLDLDNKLYELEGWASRRYGDGIHTKHRHINYHQFFINNIKPGETVLDLGSGNGFLSYNLVTNINNVKVLGIEMNKNNINFARRHYQHPNLKFILGNALKNLPEKKFNVVTLSNVLEHIENRTEFLKQIKKKIKPDKLIIRVPMLERDWRVPLKKELEINYFLDKTHFIEYRQKEFLEELKQSGLKPKHIEFRWGEIWSVVEPL